MCREVYNETKAEYFLSVFAVALLAEGVDRNLENIRSDTNWEKVKSVAKKAGSFSTDVIIEIAKNVAVEAAKHFLTNT